MPTRVRIQNRFSVSYSQCKGEHFEQKELFFDFFGEKRIFDQKLQFFGTLKNLYFIT